MIGTDRLVCGHAPLDGIERGGWFVAGFLDPALGLRSRPGGDVEVKWFRHPRGHAEARRWPRNKTATSLSVLVSGRFRIRFCCGGAASEVVLERPGDYALWGPGVGHRWEALEESVVLTVRCPSIGSRDQEETPPAECPADD